MLRLVEGDSVTLTPWSGLWSEMFGQQVAISGTWGMGMGDAAEMCNSRRVSNTVFFSAGCRGQGVLALSLRLLYPLLESSRGKE